MVKTQKRVVWEAKHKPCMFGIIIEIASQMCDALRDLVPFVQFKKREKHPWRSVIFSKVAG